MRKIRMIIRKNVEKVGNRHSWLNRLIFSTLDDIISSLTAVDTPQAYILMMEREETHKLLPTEIKELIVLQCAENSVNDVISLLCTDKSFYDSKNSLVWRAIYNKLYKVSDELDVAKPTNEIKIFLRYFLPSSPNASNSDWYRSFIRRMKYDDNLLALCVGKTARGRTGWQTVPHAEGHRDPFRYKKNLEDATYRYGFGYNLEQVLAKLQAIELKFHLCFLELTAEIFLADPTAYPISAIDFYHFTKRVNIHLMYAKDLCSKEIPDPVPEGKRPPGPMNLNFDGREPLFLEYDNVEYTIQPGREWGVYTNYAREGLFWGEELDVLMRNKYCVELSLYDQETFRPSPEFNNFSDLCQ